MSPKEQAQMATAFAAGLAEALDVMTTHFERGQSPSEAMEQLRDELQLAKAERDRLRAVAAEMS